MKTTMKLSGRVAIVTGASRGIGRAIAIELARQGAHVTVNYHTHEEEAREVVREIEKVGRHALMFQGNVADRKRDAQMVEKTIEVLGGLDILVNNAAVNIRKPFLDLEVADVEKTWGVSLWGVFHCSQLAARQMADRGGGNIVIVSSVHAHRPYPGSTAYNGAKAAINHMAYTWASELACYNIRVNVVEPGWIDTPGERKVYSEEQIRQKGKKLLMGRLGKAEEIARGVLFLVSEEDSSYITGTCLRIDGGFVLPYNSHTREEADK